MVWKVFQGLVSKNTSPTQWNNGVSQLLWTSKTFCWLRGRSCLCPEGFSGENCEKVKTDNFMQCDEPLKGGGDTDDKNGIFNDNNNDRRGCFVTLELAVLVGARRKVSLDWHLYWWSYNIVNITKKAFNSTWYVHLRYNDFYFAVPCFFVIVDS